MSGALRTGILIFDVLFRSDAEGYVIPRYRTSEASMLACYSSLLANASSVPGISGRQSMQLFGYETAWNHEIISGHGGQHCRTGLDLCCPCRWTDGWLFLSLPGDGPIGKLCYG